MKSNELIRKIVKRIPISVLRYIAYTKIGSSIIKNLKAAGVGDKLIVNLSNDVKIYSDIFSPRELQGGESYEDKVKKIFLENIHEGNTVVDVGAKIGEFSLIAARKVGPNGKIISIEPFRQSLTRLRENFILNKFNNFTILELAEVINVEKKLFLKTQYPVRGVLTLHCFRVRN